MSYYLGVVGSRKFNASAYMLRVVQAFRDRLGSQLVIVSGGNPNGADWLAKELATSQGIAYQEFPPAHYPHNQFCVLGPEHYNQPYHVSNYFARNGQIAKYCNTVLGFVVKGIPANGTMDTISQAKAWGKPYLVLEVDRDSNKS